MPARSVKSKARSRSTSRSPQISFAEYSFPGPALPFQIMNDILHASPVLCNIAYAVFWSLFLLLGGLIGAPFMLLIYLPITTLYSICAAIGKFRQQATNKPQTGSPPQGDATTLAVVITGCDTGFGRELAEKIFALCLRDDSCAKLNALNSVNVPYGNKITAIQVDVTKDVSVSAAVTGAITPWLHASPDRYLHALVNNAGIGTPGFVDMLNVDPVFANGQSYRNDMEVNFYGMIRSVQAALPLFKAQSSRNSASRYSSAIIVNVTSMAGLVASPNMSAYTCSKHAAEAFSTCLRYELADFNIQVLTVNPSFHATPLVAGISTGITRLYNNLKTSNPALFEEYGYDFIDETRKLSIRGSQAAEWRAYNVTNALIRAIYACKGGQELVGTDAKFGITALRHLPVWLQDKLIRVAFWRSEKPKCMY